MHNFYSLDFTMIQHIIIKHSVSNSFKKQSLRMEKKF